MINYFFTLGLLTFIIRLIRFSTRKKHIISILLRLEIIALGVFISLSRILLLKGIENFILIPFLTIVVCEGRLGLRILVIMTRFFGNDFLKSTNLKKF